MFLSYVFIQVGDVIATLESEYCSHTYNQHNEHCNKGSTWYDYVDINLINIHIHYDLLPLTEEIMNNVEVVILSDDQIQKRDNTPHLNKLIDPHKYRIYDLPRA